MYSTKFHHFRATSIKFITFLHFQTSWISQRNYDRNRRGMLWNFIIRSHVNNQQEGLKCLKESWKEKKEMNGIQIIHTTIKFACLIARLARHSVWISSSSFLTSPRPEKALESSNLYLPLALMSGWIKKKWMINSISSLFIMFTSYAEISLMHTLIAY